MGYEVGNKRNVATHYGPRTTDGQFGGQESSKEGLLKTAEWDFTYDKLPAAGTTALTYKLPANAMIQSAVLYVTTAFAGASTPTLQVGHVGEATDADSLIAAAQATNALITVKGSVISGAGAYHKKTIGNTAASVTVSAAAGTLTAGAAKLRVTFTYNGNV
jgi:hypothetical protein|tara:strand:+ start:41 stop:523 length:483 start_codon:yes stop_codon:yes gene_type:complete